MNYEQERHLHFIQEDICQALSDKYRRGQKEHGGNLWDRDCVTELGNEVTDLVTYFYVVKKNAEVIRSLVSRLNGLRTLKSPLARELVKKLYLITNPPLTKSKPNDHRARASSALSKTVSKKAPPRKVRSITGLR